MLKEEIFWYKWEEKTLRKAQDDGKSILLFVESSSSDWSKVMYEESFSNEQVIELINERFIPIRVNKYERPDIERFYQKVYTLMNRQPANSPLTIFLTQDLKPFYAGSYIPPHDIDAQLGFEALLRVISKKYITDYDTLVQKGDEVLDYIDPKQKNIEATKLSINITKTIQTHVEELLDKKFGGFSKAPKFPNSSTLELLFDVYELEKNPKLLDSITLTLDNMSKGGFYDLNDGGFYSYAIDQKWEKPYEVKTVYDNALLAQLYLRAYKMTNNEHYKEIAFSTIDFLLSQQSSNKLFSLNNEAIINSWNALMVTTLFKASDIEERYKVNAMECLEAILSKFYIDGTLYHTDGVKAFLEDYTFLGESLIVAYEYSSDESFLIMAIQFANIIIEQFYQKSSWLYSISNVKVKENIHDGYIPSSIASALSLLLSISSLVDDNYQKFVFKTLEFNSYTLMRQPLSSPKMTQTLLRYLGDLK